MKFRVLVALLSLFSASSGVKHYLIKDLKIEDNTLTVTPIPRFGRKFLNENEFRITYETPIDFSRCDQETLSAPFIMSVISLVWASGETYYVKSMDDDLFKALKVIKEVYKIFYPSIPWNGELIPDRLKKTQFQRTYTENDPVALCFSGGLDSVYTSLSHENAPQMLITIHGFSEETTKGNRWPDIKEQVTTFANASGNKTNFFVNSNFRELISGPKLKRIYPSIVPWREFCQESLSLVGISLPILVSHRCKKFIIPSTIDHKFIYPWGSHPFIDDNIRFKNILVKNHSLEATRFDKITFIAQACNNENIKKPAIYTCRHERKSTACAECKKSLMTCVGLVLNGEDPQDYGYPACPSQVMKTTRKIFSSTRKPFPHFDLLYSHRWKELQACAHDLKKQKQLNKELATFIDWFVTHNFNHCVTYQKVNRIVGYENYQYFLDEQWKQEFLKTH